ncbi:hypothetical protein DXA97_02260 [Clostridium sp. OF09-36]|nr:hypothetical protein DW922_03140 [Clostridium sp. AM42-4]RHV89710.1 hypothetical protein DXA97_02260 [Clostridium sp. OF09-36]HBM47923.1 hypothetical protein [Lachnoclostridium sp.]
MKCNLGNLESTDVSLLPFSNAAPVGNSDTCLNGKRLTADGLFSLTGNRILNTRSSLFLVLFVIAGMSVRNGHP